MATVKMSKLSLLGLSEEKKKLLKTLERMRCVEVFEAEEFIQQSSVKETQTDALKLKKARLEFAFSFLKKQKELLKTFHKKKQTEIKVKKASPALFTPKPVVSYDDFMAVAEEETDLFASVARLETLSGQISDLRAQEMKARTTIEQMRAYKALPIPLGSLADTKTTAIIVGTVPGTSLAKMQGTLEAFPLTVFEFFGEGNLVAAVIVCPKPEKDALLEKLTECEFSANSLQSDKLPAECIAEAEEFLNDSVSQQIEIAGAALQEEAFLDRMKLLYDYYTFALRREAAEEQMQTTAKTFFMQAWVPSFAEADLKNAMQAEDYTVFYEFSDPSETDIPPTLVINNKFADPYDSITNMYSAPSYREIDPNPVMAFFYFLLFGMMLSDAIYGALITVATFLILRARKSKKGEDKIFKILCMGGVSTMFWGVMFGSYAGIELLPPILFSPLNDPINMIILSLALGVVHIMAGIAMACANRIRDKKFADAFFEIFPWYAMFIGLIVFILNMIFKNAALKTAAPVLLISGFAALLIAGARHKKGFKRIGGALGNIYSIVNMFSDVLSYLRLFGMGLATGVIAMVVNEIAAVLAGMLPVIGYVLAFAFVLIGHLFNLGINTLGAYVHNSRLQFMEFFGKFYTGGGRVFYPLGVNTKYYKLN